MTRPTLPPERRPGPSVRVKLSLSYAGLVIVAGIALFAVGFLLLRFVPDGNLNLDGGGWVPNRSDLLEVFVRYAWWAIAGLIAFGLVGGWLLAGFVLRPLDRITEAARRAQVGTLDHRIALPGRRDELTDLADAFDAMLARMEHAIEEERRFAANASHELRTPHAIIRTMVEVAQADPDGRDVDTLLQRIGTTNDRAIGTTEALLTLARAGRTGELVAEVVDLASVANEVVDDLEAEAEAAGIRIDAATDFVLVGGDRALLLRVAANLVRNAVVHNIPGGQVEVATRAVPHGGELIVSNTGPVIDPVVALTLTEPFVRGAGRVRGAGNPEGAGLGLAIVSTIVRVHSGALEVTPRPVGGLTVRVTLPAQAAR
jgi:two-component system, OmpR family, sensor histidine kinase VanS